MSLAHRARGRAALGALAALGAALGVAWALWGVPTALAANAVPAAPGPASTAASAPVAARAAAEPERFVRHADMGDAQLSPSGRYLAFSTNVAGRLALGVVDLAQRKPAARAHFVDRDVRAFDWVNDDWLIFDLIDRQRGSGDQQWDHGAYVVHRSDGPARPLINPQWILARTDSALKSLADSRHALLHVPSDGGHDVVVGKYRVSVGGDLLEVLPLRMDLRNGHVRSMAHGMPDGAVQWLFDRHGEPRVATSRQGPECAVHWRPQGATEWQRLTAEPCLQRSWLPHTLDEQGTLWVTLPHGPERAAALHRFDRATGRPEPEPVLVAAGFDLNLAQPVFDEAAPAAIGDGAASAAAGASSQASPLLGWHIVTDAPTSVWFHPNLKAWQAEADRMLPGRVNRLSCRRCLDAQQAVVLVESSSDREPGQFLLLHPGRQGPGRWEDVGRRRRDIDPRQMATVDFHRVTTRDGQAMPVWVTRPAGDAAASAVAPRPAVLLVHGGPWVRGGRWRWSADAQFLAAQGYVVIEPEFRGSRGYGRAWLRAGFGQWGRAMQADLDDAVQWAAGLGLIQPDRVCIAGASYGGYAALMGPIHAPGRYRCAAAWVAVSEPRWLLQTDGWSDASEGSVRYSLPTMIGDPEKDPKAFDRMSAVGRAAEVKVPVLLAYGAQDRRVPLRHGQAMREALTAAGNPPQWVVYAEEAHNWMAPATRLDFALRLQAFLAQHLGPTGPAR